MYLVSRGRIVEAIWSNNNAVDANKENKSNAIAINEGASTTRQEIKKINERMSWLAGEEREGGWMGMGMGMFIYN
jgi:hypothetical protein